MDSWRRRKWNPTQKNQVFAPLLNDLVERNMIGKIKDFSNMFEKISTYNGETQWCLLLIVLIRVAKRGS